MLIYGAIIVAAGQLFFFAGLKRAFLAEITLADSCKPILAIATTYLILRAAPTMAQYLSSIIMLLGIILSAIGNLRQKQTLID